MSKQKKIQNQEAELMKNDNFYEDENYRRLSQNLNDQYWTIERPLRASILLCLVCFKSEKDMIYYPVHKTWYCTECYEVLKKGNIERGTPEEFP